MKFLICLGIVVSCLCLGAAISSNIKRKKLFWIDMVKLCEKLSASIDFGQNKVADILCDFAKNSSKDLKKIIDLFLLYIKDKAVRFDIDESLLSEEEIKSVKEFFVAFGELDSYNELGRIENYKKIFLSHKKESEEKYAKYCPLIIKLSMIFGILICILFF